MNQIVFSEVCLELNGRRIVGPLTFEIGAGETLVLLGSSGSGKTTTLRLINGLLFPTSGAVSVGGHSTRDLDPVALRRGIGYVIQETGLMPHMTALANAGLVPRIANAPAREVTETAKGMLALVGLDPDEFGERYPHELSGGQRQRVGVARALAADPPVLLCDEPFGATDPATRSALQAEFRELVVSLGKTVVFVTHDVREAVRLADRIAVIEEGRLGFIGTVAEFERSDAPTVVQLRDG